jgi:hypothetical protein
MFIYVNVGLARGWPPMPHRVTARRLRSPTPPKCAVGAAFFVATRRRAVRRERRCCLVWAATESRTGDQGCRRAIVAVRAAEPSRARAVRRSRRSFACRHGRRGRHHRRPQTRRAHRRRAVVASLACFLPEKAIAFRRLPHVHHGRAQARPPPPQSHTPGRGRATSATRQGEWQTSADEREPGEHDRRDNRHGAAFVVSFRCARSFIEPPLIGGRA